MKAYVTNERLTAMIDALYLRKVTCEDVDKFIKQCSDGFDVDGVGPLLLQADKWLFMVSPDDIYWDSLCPYVKSAIIKPKSAGLVV